MMSNFEKINNQLKKIFLKKFNKIDLENVDFTKSDVLDSIDILILIVEIEKKFKIKFSNNDFKKKNFGKLYNLTKIIEKKLWVYFIKNYHI